MAKRAQKTTIANLTAKLNEAKGMLGPITKQVESIAALISETEEILGRYQEIADGVIIRKEKVAQVLEKKPAPKKREIGLSARLKAYRKEAGLNQGVLAKKLGVNVASVRAWEQGRSNPRKAALNKIEKVLGGESVKPKKARKPRKVSKFTPPVAPVTPQA